MSEDEKTKPEAKKEIGNSGETKPAQEPEPKPAAPDEKKEKEFINFLVSLPKVVYVSKTTGSWDMSIGVCAKDFKDFDDVLREIRGKFADEIKDIETGSVIQEFKDDYMVDLIEDKR